MPLSNIEEARTFPSNQLLEEYPDLIPNLYLKWLLFYFSNLSMFDLVHDWFCERGGQQDFDEFFCSFNG